MNIKKSLKGYVNSMGTSNEGKIIQKIEPYEWVSFDVFDTLIKRNVKEPIDVFRVIETDYKIENFAKKRSEAEWLAKKSLKREITLDEIYEFYCESGKVREELKAVEKYVEGRICIANLGIKGIYDWCIEHKKNVLIISDMYLPEEVIKNILFRCGYSKYKKLYVSGTVGLSKRDGKLYKYVISDLEIIPKNIIHIGDAFISDFINPLKNGINAIKIPRNVEKNL